MISLTSILSYSREVYQWDASKDIIRLNVDITTAEGTATKLVQVLTRYDSKLTTDVPFDLAQRTNGWRLYDFWSSAVLAPVRVKITRVAKIKNLHSPSLKNTQELSEIWKASAGDAKADVEYRTIPRVFGGKSMENEGFVVFIMNVSWKEASWRVARRYSEFRALRRFLLLQHPNNADFRKECRGFPQKALVFRKSVLNARLRGLEGFVSFFLAHAKDCRQNALDALCSFLQIPEHLQSISSDIPASNKNILPPQTPQSTTPTVVNTPTSLSVPATELLPSSPSTPSSVLEGQDRAVSTSDFDATTTIVAVEPAIALTIAPTTSTITAPEAEPHASSPEPASDSPAVPATETTDNATELATSNLPVEKEDAEIAPSPPDVDATCTDAAMDSAVALESSPEVIDDGQTLETRLSVAEEVLSSTDLTTIAAVDSVIALDSLPVQQHVLPAEEQGNDQQSVVLPLQMPQSTAPTATPDATTVEPSIASESSSGEHLTSSAPEVDYSAPELAPTIDSSDKEDVSLSAAQRRLLEILGAGMQIIKHGRQGAPKARLLQCNEQATELFIQAEDRRKTVTLSDVESIRLGTDVDPVTSAEALRALQEDTSGEASNKGKRMTLIRRASYTLRGKADDSLYFGTATLRRTCKTDDMRFCLSLIMADRTFDIQCHSVEDLKTLHTSLLEVCRK